MPMSRIGRRSPAALVLAAALCATLSTPAFAATQRVYEAESATIDNPACGDNPPMRVVTMQPGASGNATVFYPGSGCSQTFHAINERVVRARLKVGGLAGTVCGHLDFTGSVSGHSENFCHVDSEYFDAAVTTTTGIGNFTVTWIVDSPSPSWADIDLDYLVLETPDPEPCLVVSVHLGPLSVCL